MDEKNQEITIRRKNGQKAKRLMVHGKPHSNYKLIYLIQKRDGTDCFSSSKDFSTAGKPSNLEDVKPNCWEETKGWIQQEK